MPDIVDTVVDSGSGTRNFAAIDNPTEVEVKDAPISGAFSRTEETIAPRAGAPELPDKVREKIAGILASRPAPEKKLGDDEDDEAEVAAKPADQAGAPDEHKVTTDDADEDDDGDPDAPIEAKAAEAKPPEPEKPAEPSEIDRIRAEADRVAERNRQLLAELEAARKPPETPPVPSLLAEAEATYIENPRAAVRKLIAASLGIADPDSVEVTAEVKSLYADLTAEELGVTPDVAHQAKREAERTQRLWAREKRQRKAEEQAKAQVPTADLESQKEEAAAPIIRTRLDASKADYPLLYALAETLGRASPERLVWRTLAREIQTGTIDPKASDGDMIAQAARSLESTYQALADTIGQAKPVSPPSTASPDGQAPSPATSQTSQEQRQSHGARTLTAADASVAPATPPAKKPQPTEKKRPTFKNEDERREYALRHLRKKR